jgi:hypothetical protein
MWQTIREIQVNIAYRWLPGYFNLALTVTGTSVGGIIALVIDNYIDPMYGAKKGNGYCFG